MNADQVADVLGTLASAGVLALVALVALRLATPARFAMIRTSLLGTGPTLAGAVAVVAMGGSLWFSKGAHFPPCELCWYQRIAMYPLAVLLPIAAWRGDPTARRSGLVLAGIGITVSTWHNLIETVPSLDPGACDPTNPCTIRWVAGLGFWTIPRMAFVAFALVIAALALDRPTAPEER